MAYGQTFSGKTYTMYGEDNSLGLLYLAARDIFDYIDVNHSSREFILRASFVELYKEEVKDLLDPSNTNPRIRESNERGVYVEVYEEVIHNYNDMVVVCTLISLLLNLLPSSCYRKGKEIATLALPI